MLRKDRLVSEKEVEGFKGVWSVAGKQVYGVTRRSGRQAPGGL